MAVENITGKKYHVFMKSETVFADIKGEVRENEPLSSHTTFKVGGNALYFILPNDHGDLLAAKDIAEKNDIKFFILGGGANVLFPDEGFSGAVISTERISKIYLENDLLHAGCGAPMSDAAEFACRRGFSGLEYFYSMPGSVGGAVYMNARCYGKSVSDLLLKTVYLDRGGKIRGLYTEEGLFSYKSSPFLKNGGIIIEALFSLKPGNAAELEKEMEKYKADRTAKGHFAYPCAGSVFKNNKDFGEPTGKIIDRLGLRGYSIGGAEISPRHANIIINKGNASAADIKELIEFVRLKVKETYGFSLEREIIYVE